MIKLPECFPFSGSWGMFLESPVIFSGLESFFRLSMVIFKYNVLIDLNDTMKLSVNETKLDWFVR